MPSTLRKLQTVGPVVAQKTNLQKTRKGYRLKLPVSKVEDVALKFAADQRLVSLDLEERKQSLESQIRSYNENIKQYKQQVKDINKRLTEEFDMKKLFDKHSKTLKKIFDKLLIVHAEYVPVGGMIFTTDLLKTENSLLGQYRIYINWNVSGYREGVRIINTYHRNGICDHPCIKQGRICPGNFNNIAQALFEAKDLFGLLEAILSFILSDDISRGWIKKWDTWNNGLAVATSETGPSGWERSRSSISLTSAVRRFEEQWRNNQSLEDVQATEAAVAATIFGDDIPF